MKCPQHPNEDLVSQQTKYGVRYACPVSKCTVVCWDGSTSTPADYNTRQARIVVHKTFDEVWKSGIMSRREAYRRLARYLELPRRQAHIGCFTIHQCQCAMDFCTALTRTP